MWYKTALGTDRFARTASAIMERVAASRGELWKLLRDTGVADKMGFRTPRDFDSYLGSSGQGGIQDIGAASGDVPDEAARSNLQRSLGNYLSGRILGEEIRRSRDAAIAEGRQPSVAELRDARRRANQRIMSEASAEGLGLPVQFQVGRRGPLARNPRLQTVRPDPVPLSDEKMSEMASGIYARQVSIARFEAQRRYDEGESDDWRPTAADMRSAVQRANQELADLGYPFVQFNVGSRGRFPTGGPSIQEITQQPDQFWAKERHRRRNEEKELERRRDEEKRRTLGLAPALDIDPDTPVVVPSPDPDETDDTMPEETAIEDRQRKEFPSTVQRKRVQMAYQPRPPLHEHCRCSIVDLVGGQVWKTAGDEFVCQECIYHSTVFNGLGRRMAT